MMRVFALMLLAIAAVAAAPSTELREPSRIVGGSVTTINVYPFGAALLFSNNGNTYWQWCGGTIINNRSILSAAHCFYRRTAIQWRIRVGSTWANSGGVVHNVQSIRMHPSYNSNSQNNDVAILRSASTFGFNNNVRAGSIAGANYNLGDNQAVWAIGWGVISAGGPASEQLRHVQIWTINQNLCRERYNEIRLTVTDNMLCSGVFDVGGRDQCQGDSGGPLIHNNVIVGVSSWGMGCGNARFPGVNTRVSRFAPWIIENA